MVNGECNDDGCNTYKACPRKSIGLDNDCPCVSCLIKSVCDDPCSEYLNTYTLKEVNYD